MNATPYVSKAIRCAGVNALARACSVSPAAVSRWCTLGALPRDGASGVLPYADHIETLSGGKFTAARVREESVAVHRKQAKLRLRKKTRSS